MSEIATKLGDQWKQLAMRLGMDYKKIDEIEAKYPRDSVYAPYVMLLKWRDGYETSMDEKRQKLLKAVRKMKRPDIQDLV